MPSKGSYFFFFLSTAFVSFGMQYFVYRQLRRFVRKDFPAKAAAWLKSAKWIFILMNIPIVFLLFRRQIPFDATTLSGILLYPFTIWIFLILMWAVILAPVAITRMVRGWMHPHGKQI
jgi:hypothetical protein